MLWPPNISDGVVLRLPREMHLCRSCWNVPRLPLFLQLLSFGKVQGLPHKTTVLRAPPAMCTFWTFQLSKGRRSWGVRSILTLKCVSRHNRVHIFNTSTSRSSRSDLTMVCSYVALLLWLGNVFHSTAARAPQQDFNSISHLPRLLNAHRFSEPTFRPWSHNTLKRHSVLRLFYSFTRFDFLSSDFFSSLTALTTVGICHHLSVLSEIWLPNFLRLSLLSSLLLMVMNQRSSSSLGRIWCVGDEVPVTKLLESPKVWTHHWLVSWNRLLVSSLYLNGVYERLIHIDHIDLCIVVSMDVFFVFDDSIKSN